MFFRDHAGIYIHIPFCDHKCIYCDFYSIITSDNIQAYLKALKKEIDYYAEKYQNRNNYVSVFFGGGTPSLMEPKYLGEILDHLHKRFSIKQSAEITMETNPGTVNREKFREFRHAGINRVSVGIQSFDKKELEFLTRIHDAETAKSAVYDAYMAGIENLSLDLIFNLPGQTSEIWLKTLSEAVNLPVKHISAYSLILERGTILNKMVLKGEIDLQGEEIDADLYEKTIGFLGDYGFEQYEVSNFAKPGYECVHNSIYWQAKEYHGFGTSAHSYFDGKRRWNVSSLKFYIDAVNEKGNASIGEEELTFDERKEEYRYLYLRYKGLNIREYDELFSEDFMTKNEPLVLELINHGLAEYDGVTLQMTGKGYAVCDEIIARIE
ncbi:MAG: radical SAM family heme chaperone HemW [Ignavibacteriaceae bacterium]|nr:radical SAM family heme chaperone HemW [Ignavibacteriaceae bacterium]